MNLKKSIPYISGIVGALLLFFIGWEYNMPVIGWISYPLLVYSFRAIRKWTMTLPLVFLFIIVRFLSINGGWDMGFWLTFAFAILVLAPLLTSLYLDRAFNVHMNHVLATLIFPSAYIVLDFFITFINVGMTFSLVYNQSTFLEFVQISSMFGSWFTGFVVAWFAPVVVLLVHHLGSLRTVRKPLILYFSILSFILLFGCFRLAFARPHSETVRIASISEEHKQDYWNITDRNTPRNESELYKPEMKTIEEKLFNQSQKAADYGAKIIFWSEGNCPLYEDDYETFLDRARSFAKENRVYFMPSCVVLLYDRTKNDNISIIINPEGNIEYRYEKTVSWYPSDSDGKLPIIPTPYGKLSTAICFDMDFPELISQANEADIMLVPGFDTKKIADFHTRVSFLRGIENGFSVIRHANKSASISADYMGNTLSYQNYFYTPDRMMISDVPTKGAWTLYGYTGEIFLWLNFAGFAFLLFLVLKKRLKKEVRNRS